VTEEIIRWIEGLIEMANRGFDSGMREAIFTELRRRGEKPAELADRFKGNRATLYRVFSGETKDPRISTLLATAEALGTDVNELVGYPPSPRAFHSYLEALFACPEGDRRLATRLIRSFVDHRRRNPK
jgi:transcriptional regulator with XRE-family HTH domain